MTGTVLVTGATGMLGSTLCHELLADGWHVRAMRRESSTTNHLEDLDVEWCTGDVRVRSNCRDATAGCDYVVHLAGLGLTDANADLVTETNHQGTKNMLESCASESIQRLVFASTAGTRRCEGVADETDEAPPIGAYQQSKSDAEAAVHEYVRDGLDAVIVHPTSVFGPGDESFTARLCKLALDPTMPAYLPGGASFVHPVDVARGIRAALESGRSGEHYILGGENLTYREALEVLSTAGSGHQPPVRVPRSAVLVAGHVAGAVNTYAGIRVFPYGTDMARLATQQLFYSSTKAERALNYSYRPFEDYVEEAINWYTSAVSGPTASYG